MIDNLFVFAALGRHLNFLENSSKLVIQRFFIYTDLTQMASTIEKVCANPWRRGINASIKITVKISAFFTVVKRQSSKQAIKQTIIPFFS